jgi:peptide/nickel transport system permease protein
MSDQTPGTIAASAQAPQEKRAEELIYTASQWKLMWRRFQKHKLAVAGGIVIALLYLMALFAGFLAPQGPMEFSEVDNFCQPQRLRFVRPGGSFSLRPYVYGMKRSIDPRTWQRVYAIDESAVYPLRFFVHGYQYRLFGLIPTDRHLFGVEEGGKIFLFGTDKLGRDLFSKIVYGSQISMSIGLVGIAISFVLGLLIGGLSGYYGGAVDTVIQRGIEILMSFPSIPLWMALSAAFPPQWSPVVTYFMITVILSLLGWTGLARVVDYTLGRGSQGGASCTSSAGISSPAS